MEFLHTFDSTANNALSVFENQNLMAALKVFLIVYAAYAAPMLPSQMGWLFDNFVYRVAVMALILWIGNHDASTSLIIAVGFIMLLNVVNKKSLFERFRSIENFEGPQTAVIPSCLNTTVYDLLESFKNDRDALLNAMLVSRVPQNLRLIDENAGLIATYLINYGFKIGTCGPPQ